MASRFIRTCFILLILCIVQGGISQPPVDRYQSPLFSNWDETQNVLFSSSVPQPEPGGGFYEWVSGLPVNVDEWDVTHINLYMDVFEPQGDTLSQRPLVIICFGGGFLSGSRDHWSIRLLCQKLAQRGFVTATIDYRLGMNVFDEDLSMRAVYRGVQDARAAVRYFRADAAGPNNYKVDPNKIFIGGHSSGGFMAIHNAYMDKELERPVSTFAWLQDGHLVPDQKCLDCEGGNSIYSGHANGIFSLAGAIGFTSFIESNTDPKMVTFHSSDDGTVPYNVGKPFSSILWLVVGSDLPTVYGSLPISTRSDAVGLVYDFNAYSNRGHGVHEDGNTALYSDIIPRIGDWFYEEELKIKYNGITGDSVVCNTNTLQDYSLGQGEGTYFDWQVTGGQFIQMSNYDSTVEVDWDVNAANRQLIVIPYNINDAKGDTVKISADVYISDTTYYLSVDDNWENLSNWSTGSLPSYCQDVFILDDSQSSYLTFDTTTHINSLTLSNGLTLEITQNSDLYIYQKKNSQSPLSVENTIINNGLLTIKNKFINTQLNLLKPHSIVNKSTGKVVVEN